MGHGHRILCNGRTSPTVGYIRVVSQGRGWSLLWDLSKKWLVEIVSDELSVLRSNQTLRLELWKTLPFEVGEEEKLKIIKEVW